MNPETEGKALVALIISLIAFGFGSGAGIVMGINQDSISTSIVNNSSQEMPLIPNTNNANINKEPQTNTTVTTNDEVYTEPSTPDNNNPSNQGNTTFHNGTP